MIENMAKYAQVTIINAMTDINHPCEVLADMYALSKIRGDFTKDRFLFVGPVGNIGLAWKEASEVIGFSLEQCCPDGYEIQGVNRLHNLSEAIQGKDIICTDSLSKDQLDDFASHQITLSRMQLANKGAIFNPCPPFFRGEEVAEYVIDSPFFVGYDFKKYLLEIQQAVIIYSMNVNG
jgi:ornithine carbamoyltransferase